MIIKLNIKMEVLDNAKPLKDSDESKDFNCRLPKSYLSRPNPSSQRQENEIAFLLRCKLELSSEVINQKSENVRLQKLCNNEQRKTKELGYKIEELCKRNEELETHLMAIGEENHRLKLQSLSNENSLFSKKLKHGYLHKYHSFPWMEEGQKEGFNKSHHNASILSDDSLKCDGWKEVSQKLLAQMRQEMKELQEFSKQFTLNEEAEHLMQEHNEQDGTLRQIEENVLGLLKDTTSLKFTFLKQQEKLQVIMQNLKECNLSHEGNQGTKIVSKSSLAALNVDQFKSKTNKFSKLSDESFRGFFMKQLEMNKNSNEKKLRHICLKPVEKENEYPSQQKNLPSQLFIKNEQSSSNENHEKQAITTEDERICPICEAVFPKVIPQKEFEAHVVEHLETESASLLDQYVVV